MTKEVSNEYRYDKYREERYMELMQFLYQNNVNATIRHDGHELKVRCTFKF
tara:strand:+ start:705 stop:857 length:153 start_codon:yes stop_codon:yes gene_type:complete